MTSRPDRIWSLFDMLLTYARAFAVTAASVEYARGQVNGLLIVGQYEAFNETTPIGESVLSALAMVKDLCGTIPSLSPVLDQIERTEAKLKRGVLPLVLFNELELLQNRIFDELKKHYYYPVTEALAAVYANAAPWGEEVYNAFPSARLDIQNAGKCVILGQGTACVFHLMRVMEVGLKVLGREAGIPYAPSWESYLDQIGNKMKGKHASKPPAWKKKEPLMKELVGDLSAIKIAWRNPTMHIVREYSPVEAEQVYGTVRTFLERVATKFKEKGRPVAVMVCLPPVEVPAGE